MLKRYDKFDHTKLSSTATRLGIQKWTICATNNLKQLWHTSKENRKISLLITFRCNHLTSSRLIIIISDSVFKVSHHVVWKWFAWKKTCKLGMSYQMLPAERPESIWTTLLSRFTRPELLSRPFVFAYAVK
jgi:hypothetical protein